MADAARSLLRAIYDSTETVREEGATVMEILEVEQHLQFDRL